MGNYDTIKNRQDAATFRKFSINEFATGAGRAGRAGLIRAGVKPGTSEISAVWRLVPERVENLLFLDSLLCFFFISNSRNKNQIWQIEKQKKNIPLDSPVFSFAMLN